MDTPLAWRDEQKAGVVFGPHRASGGDNWHHAITWFGVLGPGQSLEHLSLAFILPADWRTSHP